jgi:hypothetical protein
VPTYKSKFEADVARSFASRKLKFTYESKKYPFTQPAQERVYTPDFIIHDTGVTVECKGKLTSEERKKLLWWREAHPNVPFIIIFMRARNPIRKGSKTTYGDWATKNGFEWYDWEKGLPKDFHKAGEAGVAPTGPTNKKKETD